MLNKYKVYFDDILESIRKIEEYSNNLSYKEFNKNTLIIDAIIRNLEIIGEAVKKIPAEIKKNHPNVEWKKIAGLRDILIHEYSGIDINIIWDIITNKIPQLKTSIKDIIKEI